MTASRPAAGSPRQHPVQAPQAPSTDDARWEAVLRRDRQAAGTFVYAVVTTGVYCRPGCASRLPQRQNVRFFAVAQQAEQAGFRPCKRCTPQEAGGAEPHLAAILQACQTIEESDEPPALAGLAQAAGLSPFHFHRLFKRTVGVTPKQYAMEKRLGRLRAGLRPEVTVTQAAYQAGFASGSRFYQQAPAALGMTPTRYKNGAAGLPIRYALAPCYLGWVLVAATTQGICAIQLGDSPEALLADLRARFPRAQLLPNDPGLEFSVAAVLAFLQSPHLGLDLPLDVQGTAFQRRVWAALRQIPAGATSSYAAVAAGLGQPKAARAVAQACGANALAVAIPCHRVTRTDGGLGGYRWGVERKRALLERERDGAGSVEGEGPRTRET